MGAHIAAGHTQRRDTMVCLRVALDKRGSTETLEAHRLKEADGLGGRWRPQLTATHILLGERAKALQTMVVACFLWGAEMWAPSRRPFDTIESAALRWLRRVTSSPSAVAEEWVTHHSRRAALVVLGTGCAPWHTDGGDMSSATMTPRPSVLCIGGGLGSCGRYRRGRG